jgi:hypothetical protein
VIVQFTAPLTIPDVDRLRAAYEGLALDRYVPNLAYLERLPDTVVAALREDFLVRACVPLEPAMKMAPWTPPPAGPLEVTAVLFDEADPDAVASALAAIGARDVEFLDDRPIGGAVQVRLSLDDPVTLPDVVGIADILWVEPTPTAVDRNVPAAQVIQSGRVGPGANPIWDKGLHGEGQIIGIIDGGMIDLDHCFFADDPPNQAGPTHRKVVKIFNGTGPDSVPTEHSMFVAGIVAGDDRRNPGAHPHRGGAYAARLVCRNRFFGAGISMLGALDEARKHGAAIHNLSWGEVDKNGTAVKYYNATTRDVDRFSWDHETNLVVAAGANTGELDNSPPGIAKNALCVACAQAHPDHMTSGSGIPGPTFPDGRRKPEIMAVGCGIASALIHATDTCTTGPPSTDPCSTSWASANAAAAAALVRQYFTEGWYPSGVKNKEHQIPKPTGALIKAVLLNATDDMTGHPRYPSKTEGWGLIRLDRTLYFDGGQRHLAVRALRHDYGIESNEVHRCGLHVRDDTQPLKITLVWMDPPPAPNGYASPSTNHIEMIVKDPNGVLYLGNDIDPTTGFSRPGANGPADRLNNVQMVIVKNPPAGGWSIRTTATLTAGKRQGYALVASGRLHVNTFIP